MTHRRKNRKSVVSYSKDSGYFLKSTDNHFYIIKKEQPGSDEIPIKIADDGTCLFRALLFLKRSRSLTHRPVSSLEECLFSKFNNKIQKSKNVEQLEAYKIEINENHELTENHKRQLNDLCNARVVAIRCINNAIEAASKVSESYV